jgi:hypothetical protein
VYGAGDVDADGYADMLVAAPGIGTNTGAVYLIRGRTGPVVGKNRDSGGAWLVLGSAAPTSMSLSGADAWMGSTTSYGFAGYSVTGLGDTNGDGFDDLVVGAPTHEMAADNSGVAWLVLGTASPGDLTLEDADAGYAGEVDGDYAGSSIAGAGDVDGDGLDDLLIGAPHADSDAGAAWLMLGSASPASTGLASADARYAGVAPGDLTGWSVASARDTNGDGHADLLIGAPENDSAGDNATGHPMQGVRLARPDLEYAGQELGDRGGDQRVGGDDLDVGRHVGEPFGPGRWGHELDDLDAGLLALFMRTSSLGKRPIT